MRIKKLDSNIISIIAAGEVIENPSSVIKELIDNSIDADSHSIEIEIKNGGKDYIRVSDDGKGIVSEDLKIAFSRHATSKLNNIEDINTIESMGFRGEALPSIATVSDINLISKTKNQSHAGNINIHFGKIINEIPDTRVNGTTVVVTDLFGNMPARKKFLKSSRSESKKNYDLIKKYALCYPKVKFVVISDGRKYFETTGNGKLLDVLSKLFDQTLSNSMIDINYKSDELGLYGYASNINIKKSSNANIHCFVNNRVIKNKIFNYAIERAYDSFLVKGDYPVCIININVNPDLLDLNVHPSKNEIKIRDERELFSMIERQIRHSIVNSNSQNQNLDLNILKYKPEKSFLTFTDNSFISSNTRKPIVETNNTVNEFFTSSTNQLDLVNEFILLGQINNSFIVGEYKKEICIIDQHAAHERVNYENILANPKSDIISQELLDPIILNLTIEEDIWIQENRDYLIDIGFEIETFGISNQVLISKIPQHFVGLNLNKKLHAYLNDLKNNISSTDDDRKKTLACHASIEFGDKLSKTEIFNLIEDLSKCLEPWKCPHGRPTLLQIDNDQLMKWFKRL